MPSARCPSGRRAVRTRIASTCLLLRGFLNEFLDGLLQRLAAEALVADHALGVDHVNRREGLHVPVVDDATVAPALPPVRPRHLLVLQKLLQRLLLVVDTDADQSERL